MNHHVHFNSTTSRLYRPIAVCVTLGIGMGQAFADAQINREANDVAEAIGNLDQSFRYRGLRAGHGSALVDGASFGDKIDPQTPIGNSPHTRSLPEINWMHPPKSD